MIVMFLGVVVVNDLIEVMGLVEICLELCVVIVDGDLVGVGWVSGGLDCKLFILEVIFEIDKVRSELVVVEVLVV